MAPHSNFDLLLEHDGNLVLHCTLPPGTFVVGRDKSCDVVIHGESLSRRHARLVLRGSEWFVEDLGSKNGTRINGQTVGSMLPFTTEDQLQFGEVKAVLVQRKDPPSVTVKPAYMVMQNTKERGVIYELKGPSITVGRGRGNDIRIDEPSISREHAVLRATPDQEWALEDLESANGSFVNGVLSSRALLRGGEQVRFGNVEFLFHCKKAPSERRDRWLMILLVSGLLAALALLVMSFRLDLL